MQILIANATVNFPEMKGMPPDFLESLVAGMQQNARQERKIIIPKIGAHFPGLDALYAGIAPEEEGLPQAHLVLWNARAAGRMVYQAGIDWAAKVHLETSSHMPGKIESALVYATLADIGFTEEERKHRHWTSTKKSDTTAFCQYFGYGHQYHDDLYGTNLVRAVSRLPL